ncbi:DNA adenine methylase [Sphingomonas sp. 35-24ZXX]|uniref:DNA adenine methylase n=1 Tax=Sphingomonas sp. 35-24ZXX TaxID=1545915 RepID=UPI0018CF2CB7|nr:DNA adenine methylase [Sphingomonas sp. 35-24ZXX]
MTMLDTKTRPTMSFSPLRYPGGKGKLARFMIDLIRLNDLEDGTYVEPYAGGAAIAWELLLKGIVRNVEVNDISPPVFAFWDAVINHTETLCRTITDTPIDIEQWNRAKTVYNNPEKFSSSELGFAFFFLNRTNRSGVLNGGVIGGKEQGGRYKIDARFNKVDLIRRISNIALKRNRIRISNLDAMNFIQERSFFWDRTSLIYLDPPYYDKGQSLYLNAYKPNDHINVASSIIDLRMKNWIVSYDDVRPIHDLYGMAAKLQYTLNYSAHRKERGQEVMFFSESLNVPYMVPPLVEIRRTNLQPCTLPKFDPPQ